MTGQRLWAAVALLFMFSFGALAGAFYERHHAVRLSASVELTGAEMHAAAMAELEEVLGLDAAQLEQIHAILTRRQDLVQQVWEEVRPEVQSAMLEVHAEIADLLRPEQRSAYHEWLNSKRDESGTDRVLIIPH